MRPWVSPPAPQKRSTHTTSSSGRSVRPLVVVGAFLVMRSVTSLVVSLCVSGLSLVDPLVDLGSLELPEAPDAMSWKSFLVDPCVYAVLADPEVLGDLAD